MLIILFCGVLYHLEDYATALDKVASFAVPGTGLIVLETATALEELDAVLAVEGLDGVYVGPSDLGLSLGRAGPEHCKFMQETISSIVARAVAAGMPVGVHTADGAQAARYAEQGATIVTVAVDATVLADVVRRELAVARPEPGAASGTR